MIEVRGNLWAFPADARVITTNGSIRKDGSAVMERGCALEATRLFPDIAANLGFNLMKFGNNVTVLRTPIPWILSFPVKHEWWERADGGLIDRSSTQLVEWCNTKPSIKVVVMPRPGCGNGRLKWPDVRSVLQPILDDRFHVITF